MTIEAVIKRLKEKEEVYTDIRDSKIKDNDYKDVSYFAGKINALMEIRFELELINSNEKTIYYKGWKKGFTDGYGKAMEDINEELLETTTYDEDGKEVIISRICEKLEAMYEK